MTHIQFASCGMGRLGRRPSGVLASFELEANNSGCKAMPQQPITKPGSAEAIGSGCTCDFIKNDFGRGHANAFYCAEDCPLHGVLLTMAGLRTDVDLSNETKAALKWLGSRIARPFRRRP
jgi:hypothetical protein